MAPLLVLVMMMHAAIRFHYWCTFWCTYGFTGGGGYLQYQILRWVCLRATIPLAPPFSIIFS